MRHPRRKHRGYRGPGATPWKWRMDDGRLIRRGQAYHVRLVKDGVVLWEGEVIG